MHIIVYTLSIRTWPARVKLVEPDPTKRVLSGFTLIKKTRLFKYTENFTTKIIKVSDEKF